MTVHKFLFKNSTLRRAATESASKRMRTNSSSSFVPSTPSIVPGSPSASPVHTRAFFSTNPSTSASTSSPLLPAPLDQSLVDDLKKGAVHVWWFNEEKVPEQLLKAVESEWLTPIDYISPGRARVDSVKQERTRTKMLIRGVLSRYLSRDEGKTVHPRDIPFTWYARGKPKLAPGWGLRDAQGRKREIWFNLTHTGGAMGIALGLDHEIGLDVERKDRVMRFDPIKLAKSQLHELEHAQLLTHHDLLSPGRPWTPEAKSNPAVLRALTERLMWHWVLKESFCKATGMGINAAPSLKGHAALLWNDGHEEVRRGLARSLPQSEVHPDFRLVELRYDDRRMEVLRDDPLPPARSYEFVLHEPTEEHVTSLAVRRLHGEPGLPRMRTFHLDGILGGEGDKEVFAKALGCTVIS